MVSVSQILTVVGLLFEFLSVFVTVWEVFLPWKSWYYRRVSGAQPLKTEHKENRKAAIIFLTLLVIGIALQAIAVLLPTE